ncbi:MAG TPA: cation:dicarboxylase symporter family transporter [Gemmatales bacterium]|nr:cation:dicarboxylase symporter family transporter [Gemmatales bacterium]
MLTYFRNWSLTRSIMVAMVMGVLLGWLFPAEIYPNIAVTFDLLAKIFIWMIQSIIAPLLFATLVIGIAGHGDDVKKVGRLALKSFIYFEIVTTLALFIGLAAVNIAQPGVGIKTQQSTSVAQEDATEKAKELAKKQNTIKTMVEHIVPRSIIKAAADNEVLQIVFWAILFAIALVLVKAPHRETMLYGLEALSEVMFKFVGIVMKYAPSGVGAAIAGTVGKSGLEVLKNLILLILTLYIALIVFVVLVLLPVAYFARVPLKKFGKAVAEPALIAFSTTSSEAALPKAMQAMEGIGVPKRIVAFVMPTGYSFNLDGTTLYLAVASIFCLQASGVEVTWGQQIWLMIALMFTSKGVAAVPRASLVILSGTLLSFKYPVEAIGLILGVDALMDMARTTVNLVGNCLATVVMARWEGELDEGATGMSAPMEPALPSERTNEDFPGIE